MTMLLTLIVTCSLLSASAQTEVIWDTHNGPLSTRGILAKLNDSQFRLEVLRLLAQQHVRIGHLIVYSSLGDQYTAGGQGGTNCTYDRWRSVLLARGLNKMRTCPVISEAVKIGDAILMRTIDANCHSRQVLLEGKADPMEVELSGIKYQIVNIVIQPFNMRTSTVEDRFSPVHFFVRTDHEVTTDRGKELLGLFQGVTGVPDITVVLRNEQTFAMHCDFPLLFPFATLPTPIPTKEQYLRSKEAVCVALKQWPPRCY